MRAIKCRDATLGLLAVFGCGSCADVSAPPLVTVSDSAGVRIVTNRLRGVEAAPVWTLSAEPVIDVGSGANPAVALFRVTSVAPIGLDLVVIGMTAPPGVVVVGARGAVLAELGGEGDGPGEFMGVGSIVPLGDDSVGVWDPERRRVSVFRTDGRLIREVDLSELAPLSWIAAPSMFERSARTYLLPSSPGAWVLFSVGMLGPGDGIRRIEAPSYRLSTSGEEIFVLGSFPGESTFHSDPTGVAPYPLGPDTYGATTGEALIVGTASGPEVRWYTATGSLAQIGRWPEPDREVGGERLAAWSDHVRVFLEPMTPGERADIREILDVMPEPAVLPAFTGLLTSDLEEVWIGGYHPGQLSLSVAFTGRLRVPERCWLVLGADGALRATVTTPLGFRPMTVREGRVWGVFTDQLGVEAVRAYEVERE